MNAATRATALIAAVRRGARTDIPGDHSVAQLSTECGALAQVIHNLCAEQDQYANPSKLDHYTVTLHDVEFQVGAAFDSDEDFAGNRRSTIVEACYYIRGQDVSALLSLEDSAAIDEQVIAQYEQGLEDDEAMSALEDYRERRAA